MKVLHIVTSFDIGGAERVALNIAKSKERGIEYHMVEVVRGRGIFSDNFIKELLSEGIIYHRALNVCNKLGIILFPFRFLFIYLQVKPQIIHTHTEIPDLSLYLWNRLFGWTLPNVRIVRTIHNTELWNKWKWIGKRVELWFQKRKANVAIGIATQQAYLKEYGECPVIVENGVEEKKQYPFYGIIPNKINILFAGRFEKQKGVDILCGVIRRLSSSNMFVFHIVGNGSMQDMINSLRGLPNVFVYERIFGLSTYLSSFDYLFMPSRYEGLGLMSIEASMAKLPTIINPCSGLKDTLPKYWPLSVEKYSVDAFTRVFSNLNSYDKQTLGESAYAFVKERYSIMRMQAEYEKFYN